MGQQDHLQTAYAEASKQLRNLLLKRSEIDTQIAQLREALQILAKLTGADENCEESVLNFLNAIGGDLSKATRALLRVSAATPMTATDSIPRLLLLALVGTFAGA